MRSQLTKNPLPIKGSAIQVPAFKSGGRSKTQHHTPTKGDEDVKDIVWKYLSQDQINDSQFRSTAGSITTIFHTGLEEENAIMVSPYKALSREDCERYFDTFQKASDSAKKASPAGQDEFHHLKTESDQSIERIEEIVSRKFEQEEEQQRRLGAFESPRRTSQQLSEQSPDFFNPVGEPKQFPAISIMPTCFSRDLPIIEEQEEIKSEQEMTAKIQHLRNAIDVTIQQSKEQNEKIQKIKEKYEFKEEATFGDFPSHDFQDLDAPQSKQEAKRQQFLQWQERNASACQVKKDGKPIRQEEQFKAQSKDQPTSQQSQKSTPSTLTKTVQQYLKPQNYYNISEIQHKIDKNTSDNRSESKAKSNNDKVRQFVRFIISILLITLVTQCYFMIAK